jgi:hypothetical protein
VFPDALFLSLALQFHWQRHKVPYMKEALALLPSPN